MSLTINVNRMVTVLLSRLPKPDREDIYTRIHESLDEPTLDLLGELIFAESIRYILQGVRENPALKEQLLKDLGER